tara:strand:- start:585 stop:785 length:201 start_codon:yes stop_codon:yes gene_type:complete
MISYPTTTLPLSPPYHNIDDIMIILTDRCLIIAEDKQYSELEREQYFHFTMTLVDFWLNEESRGAI